MNQQLIEQIVYFILFVGFKFIVFYFLVCIMGVIEVILKDFCEGEMYKGIRRLFGISYIFYIYYILLF